MGLLVLAVLFILLVTLFVTERSDATGKEDFHWLQLLGVLVAALGVFGSFVNQQRKNMVDTIRAYNDQFDRLLPKRTLVCGQLDKNDRATWEENGDSIDDILNLFEEIALSVRIGALSFTLADEHFSYYSVRYYRVASDRIKRLRTRDKRIYTMWEWFNNRLVESGDIGDSALREFIREEATEGVG